MYPSNSSNVVTDQNLWTRYLVVWGVGNGCSDFRWALPCEYSSFQPLTSLIIRCCSGLELTTSWINPFRHQRRLANRF